MGAKRTGWPGTSRHERGYGNDWTKLRLLVLRRDCGLCQPCKARGHITIATEVDHIKDKAKGGTDDMDNLQAICKPCHATKTAAAQGRTLKPRRMIGLDGWPV